MNNDLLKEIAGEVYMPVCNSVMSQNSGLYGEANVCHSLNAYSIELESALFDDRVALMRSDDARCVSLRAFAMGDHHRRDYTPKVRTHLGLLTFDDWKFIFEYITEIKFEIENTEPDEKLPVNQTEVIRLRDDFEDFLDNIRNICPERRSVISVN
ncbi:MAG: hypothetical protein KKG75_00100 [Nanoarchaeota archaeon]|nr:hypothetical protein [Nanoarchaeota archaeon]